MKKIALFFLPALLLTYSCNTNINNNKDKRKIEKQQLISDDIIRAGTADGNRIFITKNGDTLFNGKTFYNAHEFKNGYCVVSQKINNEVKKGIINIKGEELIPITLDESINDYDNGFFRIFRKNSGYGYIDTTGKIVIEPIYAKVQSVRYNLVKAGNKKYKWGIINTAGKEIVPFKYESIGKWRDGLATIKLNNKYGYIDTTGKTVIELQYSFALPFEDGIALVKKNGKIGFIDKNNNTVIDFIYDDYKTIADVYEDNTSLSGYAERNNRFSMKEGYIVLKKNNKWGYINKKGEIIIPFEFDEIGIPANESDKVNVVKDGKRGAYYINKKKLNWY